MKNRIIGMKKNENTLTLEKQSNVTIGMFNKYNVEIRKTRLNNFSIILSYKKHIINSWFIPLNFNIEYLFISIQCHVSELEKGL